MKKLALLLVPATVAIAWFVRPQAVVTSSGAPPVLEGRIANLGQTLDPQTRTMQVRIVLNNSGNQLRPEMLATAEIPDEVSRLLVGPDQLPAGWRRTPPPASLAAIGDSFVREGRSALLAVPSALAPEEMNLLINPLHTEFALVRSLPVRAFQYDQRFFT